MLCYPLHSSISPYDSSCNHLASDGHMASHLNGPEASDHIIDERPQMGDHANTIPISHEGAPTQDVR